MISYLRVLKAVGSLNLLLPTRALPRAAFAAPDETAATNENGATVPFLLLKGSDTPTRRSGRASQCATPHAGSRAARIYPLYGSIN